MADASRTGDLPGNDDQWREKLGEERYRILRQAGTEAPWSGALLGNKAPGDYVCAGCSQPLFDSDSKFESGSGWPSFTTPIDDQAVATVEDSSHGMRRVEVRCPRCQSHLGHVFPDGPGPEGLRYCINSASLDFKPEE